MLKNCAAVLQFGSTKVSVMIGARGVNNTINILGKGEHPYDGHQGGEFLSPNKVEAAIFKAIKQANEHARTEIDRLFIGVPTEFSLCSVHDVSVTFDHKKKIGKSDIDELYEQGNVYRDAPDYAVINRTPIFFTTDDTRRVVDIIGVKSTMLSAKISYILADKRFMGGLQRIMESMNVSATFVSAPLTEVLYLFDSEARDMGVVLCDIDELSSSLIIAKGDGLLAIRSFSRGGAYINDDLMQVFGIDYKAAEQLRKKINLPLAFSETDTYEVTVDDETRSFLAYAANEVVTDRIESYGVKIKRGILNCGIDLPEYLPVYITGGGISYIRGAKDIVARGISRPTEIISPGQAMLDKPHLANILGLMNFAIDRL